MIAKRNNYFLFRAEYFFVFLSALPRMSFLLNQCRFQRLGFKISKNFSKKLLVLIILLLACGDGYAKDQDYFPFIAEVTSDSLNVRSGQSENFERIFRLEQGDHVVVLTHSFSWYKIELPNGTSGFVSRQFIDQSTGRVTGDRVNVRSRNGGQATILCQVNKGDDIEILELIDDWYRIKPLEDCYGWVRQKYLKFYAKIPSVSIKLPKKVLEIKKKIPSAEKKAVEIQSLKKVQEVSSIKKETQVLKNSEKLVAKKVRRKKKKRKENKDSKVRKIKKDLKEKKNSKIKKIKKEFKVKKNSKPEKIAVVGVIRSLGNVPLSKVYVKLVTKDKKVYFLKGLHHILKGFSGETVKVEGATQPENNEGSEFPVINVIKFQLVL